MNKNCHWFKTDCIGNGITAINECGLVTLYLIEGKEKALLVDTGWGAGDLAGLITSLTPLPVIVINTHGHPDHVSGSYQFGETAISADDQPLFLKCFRPEYRKIKYGAFLTGMFPDSETAENWINAKPNNTVNIDPGSNIELGDRKILILPVPGHTKGSIALFDENGGLLFTGDAIIKGDIWMHLNESTALTIFLKSLKSLPCFERQVKALLPAHGETPVDPSIIDELITGTKRIIDTEICGEPVRTFAGEGLRYKFENCGVIYDKNKLK